MEAPIDIVSAFWMFETEKGETRAWAERHYRDGGSLEDMRKFAQNTGPILVKAESTSSVQTDVLTPDSILPGLTEFLEKKNLPSSSFFAVHLKRVGAEAPMLSDHYSAPGVEVDVSSTAVRDGENILIQTTIKTSGTSEGRTFSIPAIFAWDKARKPLTDLKQYAAFVSIFNDQKKHAIKHAMKSEKEWAFRWSFPVKTDSKVYRMDHPVYISGGDRRDCVMIASYSPSPLNFSFGDCREWLRLRGATNFSRRLRFESNASRSRAVSAAQR